MKKQLTKFEIIGIVLKLTALAAFIGFIAVGGYNAYTNIFLNPPNLQKFFIFAGLFIFGIFLVAVIACWILYFDGNANDMNLAGSLFIGLVFAIAASSMLFLFIGIVFWIENGNYKLGLISIVTFIIMIIIMIEFSILWQTENSIKVKHDKNAIKTIGTVINVKNHFGIILFFKKLYLIKEYTIEIDGVKTTAKIRSLSRLTKNITIGSSVNVKFNPRKPKYSAIVK